jgi:hypothetical protein
MTKLGPMTKLASLVVLSFASLAYAQATLVVPSAQYPTIQSAITAAVNMDTVLVSPGVYVENLDVLGKDITIRSAAGAAATTIDGTLGAQPTVRYPVGSTRASVLDGFTVTGGTNLGTTTDRFGGGIRINGASPTIRNCIVRGNAAGTYGGGIGACDINTGVATSPLIERCLIENNTASSASFASGGGISIGGLGSGAPTSTAEIRHCTIRGNSGNTRGGGIMLLYNANVTIDSNVITDNTTRGLTGNLDGGAGIWFGLNAIALITNNRIYRNNSGSNGGGIKWFNVTGARIVNNTITENTGGGIAGFANAGAFGNNVVCDVVNCIVWNNGGGAEFAFTGLDQNAMPPSANVSFSDVSGGYPGTGNINANPLLLNTGSGNHRLAAGSPCRDVGNSSATQLPSVDFEGDMRVVGTAVDIGADEFVAANVLLWADRDAVSVAAPSNVTYALDGGVARGGNAFAVFFSLSGTYPGLDFGGQHLPLNIDTFTLTVPPLLGVLNGSGQGNAVFPLGGVFIPRSFIGETLSAAAAVLGAGLLFTNDENVRFVP